MSHVMVRQGELKCYPFQGHTFRTIFQLSYIEINGSIIFYKRKLWVEVAQTETFRYELRWVSKQNIGNMNTIPFPFLVSKSIFHGEMKFCFTKFIE